jgi:hypothetical protein
VQGGDDGIRWVYNMDAFRPTHGLYPEVIANASAAADGDQNAARATVDMLSMMELFKFADALVGSMLSNVFRLACELNFVTRGMPDVQRFATHNNRCHSVDVPWYMDP